MKPMNGPVTWVFKEKTLYEFTINFADQYQWPLNPLRHSKCYELLSNTLSFSLFWLFPEISMPQYGDRYTNDTARIHYHGIIAWTDKRELLEFLLTGYNNLTNIGRIQFNEFRPDHWPDYCLKNYKLFKPLKAIKNIKLQGLLEWSKRDA